MRALGFITGPTAESHLCPFKRNVTRNMGQSIFSKISTLPVRNIYVVLLRFLILFELQNVQPYTVHFAQHKTSQSNGENIRQQSYLQAHQVYLAGNSSHSFFMHRLLCFNMHDKIHLRLLIETLIVQKMKDFVPNKCLTLNHEIKVFLLQNNCVILALLTMIMFILILILTTRGSRDAKGPKVSKNVREV